MRREDFATYTRPRSASRCPEAPRQSKRSTCKAARSHCRHSMLRPSEHRRGPPCRHSIKLRSCEDAKRIKYFRIPQRFASAVDATDVIPELGQTKCPRPRAHPHEGDAVHLFQLGRRSRLIKYTTPEKPTVAAYDRWSLCPRCRKRSTCFWQHACRKFCNPNRGTVTMFRKAKWKSLVTNLVCVQLPFKTHFSSGAKGALETAAYLRRHSEILH